MNGAWKKTALTALLALAAVTLAGCLVEPAPYYGDGYYAEPAPVYVGPRYYYGSRGGYWYRHGWHGGGWHGGGWHGGGGDHWR